MHRIEKTKLLHDRLDRYDQKKYSLKRRKLRDNLNIGEKVLVLAERIKKKSAPGKFFKQSVQKISYFNKEKTFLIRKKQKIDKITYYWYRDTQTILLCKTISHCNNLWKQNVKFLVRS